jgi:signal transduction histidine kinase
MSPGKRKAATTDIASRSRLRKIRAELDLKERKIGELNEELANAICRIRDMETELIRIREEARQTDILKQAFIANISHEIRTPMNAIVGLTSFLNDPSITRNDAEGYIEIINSSCIQLLAVIDDIVDIAKIESGQLTITIEKINLNDILRDLYSKYSDQATLKNINLSYSAGFTDDHAQIRTDRLRIRQVFRNLLSNAFKFTETGNIDFGYYPDEGKITFYVRDDGIGIPPENQSLIFNRFWTGENSITRLHEGLGLGLSISKKIVEKMGGNIRVESGPGKGSVFYFTIPTETRQRE